MRLHLMLASLALLAFAPMVRAADPSPEPGPTWPKTLPAHRVQSRNNLKMIALAMHSHHDVFKGFPAAAAYSKGKKPLLSWRVAILPYIEEDALYKKFKLDEPWDSPHNKKLIPLMPKVYAPPMVGKPAKAGHTYYQAFTGNDAVFDPRWTRASGGTLQIGPRLTAIKDGTSNTAMVVEAGEAVPWTKPDDIPYDPKKPLPKLGGLFKEGFNVAMCDGSVRMIGRKAKEKALRALITPSGGEIMDWKDLPGPETKK
jgi:prepilin-type processing-associated H-X9-DG protein